MIYTIGTTVFKDWEIVSEIGEGSYGKVFELKKTGFKVTAKSALKVIRIPRSSEEIREARNEGMDEQSVTSYFEGIVNRFMSEIEIMSTLKAHPNIVGCEDYEILLHEEEIGWDILIRMELLTPLKKYLNGPMREEEVRRLAVDICRALVFCQKKGLIHRDVKPDNIFIDELGSFKLGDFGVARSAEKTMGGMSKQGTENYMAPEVYLGQPYGPTVDIYSLGLTLYRLLNKNRMPFLPLPPNQIEYDDRENSLARRIRGEGLPPPCDASEGFAEIILKACAYDPKDRYRTAAEMLEALTGVKAVDTAVDENGFAQQEVEEFKEEDGSVGTRGVFFRRKCGKAGAEEVLPGGNTILVAETGDGWPEEGTIGTVGPGFRRRKKAEATGTGLSGNDAIPPEEVPPAATPPGPEIPSGTATPPGTVTPPGPEIPSGPETPPEEEKEKSSKRPLLLGGGAAAILALALVAGMSKKDSVPPEEIQVVEMVEETAAEAVAAAESLEETMETEVGETSAEEAELADLRKDSLNPDYVSLDEDKVLYESVDDAVFVGKNQVNREKLSSDETLMIPVIASHDVSWTKYEFQLGTRDFKERLDVLETPYALGYYGGHGENIAIRISPDRMGLLVESLLYEIKRLTLEIPYTDSSSRFHTVKSLEYQLVDGRWKVTAGVEYDEIYMGDLFDKEEVNVKLYANGEFYSVVLGEQTVPPPEFLDETVEFSVYLDCFSMEKPQEEYAFVLDLMKTVMEEPYEPYDNGVRGIRIKQAYHSDAMYSGNVVSEGKTPYGIRHETEEDREMVTALRRIYPTADWMRMEYKEGPYENPIDIYLVPEEIPEFADETQEWEYFLELCEKAFKAWDFDGGSYEHVTFHVKMKEDSYDGYELTLVRSDKEEQYELLYISDYNEELKTAVKNSAFFAPRYKD